MSTNKQALREAAEKAIQEEGETWWNEEQLASDYGLALHKADAKFIAAANPATVLALLDELEAAEKYAKERDAENEDLMLTVGRLRVEKEAAEKRIAELEAREVVLPKPISVLHRRDFIDSHRSINAYPEAEVNAALAAAGITVKGE